MMSKNIVKLPHLEYGVLVEAERADPDVPMTR